MRTFEPRMAEQIDIFLQLLLASSRSGSAVNMTERCQRLGMDIVGLLSFGYPFKTQTGEGFRFLPPVIDTMSWRISPYMQFPPLTHLDTFVSLFGISQGIQFLNSVKTMIKTRMSQDKNAHHDLYSILADHIGKDQQGLYEGELWPEAMLFIMAGGSTTATAMSALFFYLARNPECYAALADEIRSKFNSASDIQAGPQLNACKYLRACVDEALRMSPPVPTVPWREQFAADESSEPFIVDGHVIPRGTQVGVNLYCIMHNEEYFPDSFSFKPERWLESGPHVSAERNVGEDTAEKKRKAEERAAMRKAFAPFLIGDRSCAGRSMAYMETSLTIARTLWYFDFEVAPGKAGELGGGKPGRTDGRGRPGEYQLHDIFVATHQGPYLVFRTRGDFWKELHADA